MHNETRYYNRERKIDFPSSSTTGKHFFVDQPRNEKETPEQEEAPIRIFYRERDILNLGANLREPFWQMRVPMMPRYDYKNFMENRSVYYRFGEHGLTRDYPTKTCQDCGFCEPSPYLF